MEITPRKDNFTENLLVQILKKNALKHPNLKKFQVTNRHIYRPALCKCTSFLCSSMQAYIAWTSKSSNKLGLKSLKYSYFLPGVNFIAFGVTNSPITFFISPDVFASTCFPDLFRILQLLSKLSNNALLTVIALQNLSTTL